MLASMANLGIQAKSERASARRVKESIHENTDSNTVFDLRSYITIPACKIATKESVDLLPNASR